MADLERVAVRVSDGLRYTLSRISKLAIGMAGFTAAIGVATFLTGLWVFDASSAWIIIGGAICFAPTAAALLAWSYVRMTARVAPQLLGNVNTVLHESGEPSNTLINYDTGERLANTARTFRPLSVDLKKRRTELPALFLGVRAIRSVPALVAIALLGTMFVGMLGTVLLITGLFS